MKPDEYDIRVNSFNSRKALWFLAVLLLTILVATEWALRIVFPHQDYMYINLLTTLSIADALCIFSLGLIYEQITITGMRLRQKGPLSTKEISFDQSVVLAPYEPSIKNGKPQAYRLLLKDAAGVEIIIDASMFPRDDCIAIAEYLEGIMGTVNIAEDALPEVQRILDLWKNSTHARIKTVFKYLVLLVCIGFFGMSAFYSVHNARNIYSDCNEIRTDSLVVRAPVKSIDLKYQDLGFHGARRSVLYEYPANTISEATIVYATVILKSGENVYTPTIRAEGATPEDRAILYEKLKTGLIQVRYSPHNLNVAVLAGSPPSDYNVCSL